MHQQQISVIADLRGKLPAIYQCQRTLGDTGACAIEHLPAGCSCQCGQIRDPDHLSHTSIQGYQPITEKLYKIGTGVSQNSGQAILLLTPDIAFAAVGVEGQH